MTSMLQNFKAKQTEITVTTVKIAQPILELEESNNS